MQNMLKTTKTKDAFAMSGEHIVEHCITKATQTIPYSRVRAR